MVRRIGSVVSWVFVLALLVLSLGFLVTNKMMDWHLSTILTGSMEPSYPVGSSVVISPVSPNEVVKGDVITFQVDDHRVTHRVVEIKEVDGQRYFLTQGDANNVRDDWQVRPEDLIGRARADIPYLGYVLSAIATPAGIGVSTTVIAGAFFLGFLGKNPNRA